MNQLPPPGETRLGLATLGGAAYQASVSGHQLNLRENRQHGAVYAIALAGVVDIRVADESYDVRKIPAWAVALAVVFFPLGLLFLLVKQTNRVQRATVTLYTTSQAYTFTLAGSPQQAHDRWYPLFAAAGRVPSR